MAGNGGSAKTVVVAFSGGLASSWLVAQLAREGLRVVAVTVDAGTFTEDELEVLAGRARELGAQKHVAVEARAEVFERHLTYLIKANVLRGGRHSLWLTAEHYVEARNVGLVARRENATAIHHGCGDDRLAFETALRAAVPELDVRATVRDRSVAREQLARELGIKDDARSLESATSAWGSTTRGVALEDAESEAPDAAFPLTTSPREAPDLSEEFELEFVDGVPVRAFGAEPDGVALVRRVNDAGRRHGLGRGVQTHENALGQKERLAFEAPAARILVEAHRELESLVLTSRQRLVKDQLALTYGQLFHDGLLHDPVMRDLEALLDSSQRLVSGTVRVQLYRGNCDVTGVSSPHALGGTGRPVGRDVTGFVEITAAPVQLAARRDAREARARGATQHSSGGPSS